MGPTLRDDLPSIYRAFALLNAFAAFLYAWRPERIFLLLPFVTVTAAAAYLSGRGLAWVGGAIRDWRTSDPDEGQAVARTRMVPEGPFNEAFADLFPGGTHCAVCETPITAQECEAVRRVDGEKKAVCGETTCLLSFTRGEA